ncbi:hypothetical protein [Nocardioides speluncae]|uniref:hypothetical protein n=1 Tax=Nocardioides speluncae TaxID=2670337 RepID=UPI000D695806|nr:hypothetical protein [Nocardioides speluncae]
MITAALKQVLTRENVKLVVVAVGCLLIAWTGPSVAHGVHAQFAHNADKVDGRHAVGPGASLSAARQKLVAHDARGMLPDKFVGKPATIVTMHAGTGWLTSTEPMTVQRTGNAVVTSGNGFMVMPLQSPRQWGAQLYVLAKVELCFETVGSGKLDAIYVYDSNPTLPGTALRADSTNRYSPGGSCLAIPVRKPVTTGANLAVIVDGVAPHLYGVRAQWTS